MLDLLRRVAALTLVSVVGIALLAPLTYATHAPDLRSSPALTDPDARPAMLAGRGSLSERDLLSARSAALDDAVVEQLDAVALPSPATAPMEASLYTPLAAAPLVATPAATPLAATPVPAVPTTTAPPFVLDAAVWDRLAQCESSGNWAANTGNGYYGGLQFGLATWQGYGGAAFAAYPHQATREQQITVAERVYAVRGFQPWPACRVELGLP